MGRPRAGLSGLSEVLLTFSNDGEVSVPWSEIGLGRRLYRDGESEYLLNKTVCRLKDIHDLFLGTGVNPKAYALMEQERLAQILTAKPLDRRVFVEEAAGITRYKQQRAETLTQARGHAPEPPARARRDGRGQAPARLPGAPGEEGPAAQGAPGRAARDRGGAPRRGARDPGRGRGPPGGRGGGRAEPGRRRGRPAWPRSARSSSSRAPRS